MPSIHRSAPPRSGRPTERASERAAAHCHPLLARHMRTYTKHKSRNTHTSSGESVISQHNQPWVARAHPSTPKLACQHVTRGHSHCCHTTHTHAIKQPQNNKPPIMHAPSILQTTHNHMPPQTHGSIAYALVAVQQACARHLRSARKPIVTRPVLLVSSVPCCRRRS